MTLSPLLSPSLSPPLSPSPSRPRRHKPPASSLHHQLMSTGSRPSHPLCLPHPLALQTRSLINLRLHLRLPPRRHPHPSPQSPTPSATALLPSTSPLLLPSSPSSLRPRVAPALSESPLSPRPRAAMPTSRLQRKPLRPRRIVVTRTPRLPTARRRIRKLPNALVCPTTLPPTRARTRGPS